MLSLVLKPLGLAPLRGCARPHQSCERVVSPDALVWSAFSLARLAWLGRLCRSALLVTGFRMPGLWRPRHSCLWECFQKVPGYYGCTSFSDVFACHCFYECFDHVKVIDHYEFAGFRKFWLVALPVAAIPAWNFVFHFCIQPSIAIATAHPPSTNAAKTMKSSKYLFIWVCSEDSGHLAESFVVLDPVVSKCFCDFTFDKVSLTKRGVD